MANNRLYIVDTATKKYICFAKTWNSGWQLGNKDIFIRFFNELDDIDTKCSLKIGTELDDCFYNKWISRGINLNESGKWEYDFGNNEISIIGGNNNDSTR